MKLKNKGIFITGTDTGVGKTYVARGIAAALKYSGINVGVMKPAETGCRRRSGKLLPADALRLIAAAGVTDALSLVNPYTLHEPLAPAVAAERKGRSIDPETIIRACRTLAARHDFMLVEGAGGVMVPLTYEFLFLDLAAALRLPALIVARPGLGTINHTLLTVSALHHRRIRIAGIVINYAGDWKTGLAEKTNPAIIERMSGVRVLGVIKRDAQNFDQIIEAL